MLFEVSQPPRQPRKLEKEPYKELYGEPEKDVYRGLLRSFIGRFVRSPIRRLPRSLVKMRKDCSSLRGGSPRSVSRKIARRTFRAVQSVGRTGNHSCSPCMRLCVPVTVLPVAVLVTSQGSLPLGFTC